MLEAWAGQVFEFDSASCKHVFQFHLACSMAKRHHKKSAYQATRDEIDPELRLRENISDLFLSGDIPAKRARNLFADASAARASNVEDLGAVAEGGNTHRDLLRKLQKNSKMPPLYEAPIPMWNPNTNQREVQNLVFGWTVFPPNSIVQRAWSASHCPSRTWKHPQRTNTSVCHSPC